MKNCFWSCGICSVALVALACARVIGLFCWVGGPCACVGVLVLVGRNSSNTVSVLFEIVFKNVFNFPSFCFAGVFAGGLFVGVCCGVLKVALLSVSFVLDILLVVGGLYLDVLLLLL